MEGVEENVWPGEKRLLFAIRNRRSIRKFRDKPLTEMDLHMILEAGMAAPSSKNRQPWHFTIVRGKAKEELVQTMEKGLRLEMKADKPFLPESMPLINGAYASLEVMKQAPVVILVRNERGADPEFKGRLSADERVAELCNVQSIAAAIENMLLAAQSLKIGSLWLGDIFFAYPELSAWLNARDPGHGMLIAGLCFGYGAEAPRPRSRKALHDMATFLQ